MISLHSLRCFMITAEERNFTRAAKRLYISQQALSHHITKLEDYFGAKLFDRSIPVTLTESGQTLYKYAKNIFDSMGDCTREINDIKDFKQGELTIAIPVTRGSLMLPPLLSRFHQMFPQVRLNLVEGDTGMLLETLLNSTSDLCIGYVPEKADNLSVTPLYDEKFAVLVPNKYLGKVKFDKKYDRNSPMPIELFADLPFITQALGTRNGEVFQALCRNAGIEPEIILSTQNLITLASLSMEGLGACVIPLSFIMRKATVSKNTILFNPSALKSTSAYLIDTQQIRNISLIGIYRRKDRALTRAAEEFIKLSKEMFGEEI